MKLEPKNLRNLRNFEAGFGPFHKKPELQIDFLVSYKKYWVYPHYQYASKKGSYVKIGPAVREITWYNHEFCNWHLYI